MLLRLPFLLLGANLLVALLGLAASSATARDDAIKLGFIGPLSGGNAQQGLGARNGFLLAIEQAKAAGFPYEVEAVVLDDASDPTVGVSAAQKLVNDPQVLGVSGHWNSSVALATAPIFDRSHTPLIVWGAVSPKITEQNYRFVTRVVPTLLNENRPLAEAIVRTQGIRRIAIISDTSDYGVANTKWFGRFFEAAGGSVVYTGAASTGTTDFRAMLTSARASRPDALYFGGVVTEAALVRAQMADLGMASLPMYGISGIYDPKFLEIAGASAEGTIAGTPSKLENAALRGFDEAYARRSFADPAGSYAKYAYEATRILLRTIAQVGTSDREALAAAIRNKPHEGVLGKFSFDRSGQAELEMKVDLNVVEAGRWRTLSSR